MSHLGVGGIGFLVAPDLAIRLLGTTGPSRRVMLRLVGGFMVVLSLVVIGIVRDRVEVLYPITFLVRVVLLTTLLWGLLDSRDPMFLWLAGIVVLGMMMRP